MRNCQFTRRDKYDCPLANVSVRMSAQSRHVRERAIERWTIFFARAKSRGCPQRRLDRSKLTADGPICIRNDERGEGDALSDLGVQGHWLSINPRGHASPYRSPVTRANPG